MKAAVYYETGDPDVFRYEDVPEPACPPSGVLIDVKAVSIEGGDVLNRAGGEMPARPHIVGYQCAGIVRGVGPNATGYAPGDEVVAIMPHGSHASVVAVSTMSTWHVPQGGKLEEAACVPVPFGTAHDCLFEFGRLQTGESVLIQAGAGGVGIAAIQLAKRAGATVLSTASSDDRLERLKEYGLDHGINYRSSDWVAQARAATGGRGVDLVVDSVGTTLAGSVEAAGYRGRIIVVGNAGRAEERMLDITTLSQMNKSLTSVFFGAEMMMRHERAWNLVNDMINDVATGALRVAIDRTYPLSEAAEAHRYIESRQAFGRVLLIP
jgi:NADPH2:quinone reductase